MTKKPYRKTSLLLKPSDDELLDQVRKLYGLNSTIDAIRLALTLAVKKEGGV